MFQGSVYSSSSYSKRHFMFASEGNLWHSDTILRIPHHWLAAENNLESHCLPIPHTVVVVFYHPMCLQNWNGIGKNPVCLILANFTHENTPRLFFSSSCRKVSSKSLSKHCFLISSPYFLHQFLCKNPINEALLSFSDICLKLKVIYLKLLQ